MICFILFVIFLAVNSFRITIRQNSGLKAWIAAGTVLVFGGTLLLFGKDLISLFLHEGQEALDLESTLRYGESYLHVMLLQMVPFSVTQFYAGTMRRTGETLLPMRAGISAVLINLVLNYVLIFGKFGAPALGVVGAASATVIARVAEMLTVVVWAHRHTDRLPYMKGLYRTLRVPWSLTSRVLVLGTPLLINELL